MCGSTLDYKNIILLSVIEHHQKQHRYRVYELTLREKQMGPYPYGSENNKREASSCI